MNFQQRAKTTALIVTILLHIGVLLFCIFSAFITPLPLPGEEGVEVQLGTNDAGSFNDFFISPQKIEYSSETKNSGDEDILTSHSEEEIYMPEEEKSIEEEKKQTESVEEVKPKEPVVNPNALYKGSRSNNNSNSNNGSSDKEGSGGSLFGTTNSTNLDGLGGVGNGTSFSLEGRNALSMPKPEYSSQEQGTIVVEIMVDKKGNVINAEAGKKGTTIIDQNLWNKARNAALKAKFTPKPNAKEIQKGTITYNFRRINE